MKRLGQVLFWIRPLTQNDFPSMMNLGYSFKDAPIRRLDRWTQSVGIELDGIPLHAWDGMKGFLVIFEWVNVWGWG